MTVPLIKVVNSTTGAEVALPAVFSAPIRADVVNFVHTNLAKNKRQPYAISDMSGHQHSAESWGTGRAVSRIPRVAGSGTHRASQGAFGNMCRAGRMFAPTKVWRRWHRNVNVNQRRFAVASAIAASAVTPLVLARGHRVERVASIPLVIDNSAQSIVKTKDAIALLAKLHALKDINKVKATKKIRAGRGKMRNRRYVQRKGPLVVFSEDNGIVKAFRNIPGIELAHVERLNLLQLAPGGHLGRFIIWTQDAFTKLDEVYKTQKAGYTLPEHLLTNPDVTSLLASPEIKAVLKARGPSKTKRAFRKKNPLTNLEAMLRLNPYAAEYKKVQQAKTASKASKKEGAKKNKKFASTITHA
ncbi:50S ribosomal protein L4e [Fonticula alba]|uniref:50S ribosomal protein L4e n=1 Tax=Fonticula alba TaxID=691883 RepID=A0A058ZGC8_FONAL|nr:50S ribosomal protein L4e [Fonticula alba]KCV72963.1 50S ribosomal protein L4e [Fonticula alba]|eukprot:XP_009492664.1 50S ribosomal protein L4e [Fonticula alba]